MEGTPHVVASSVQEEDLSFSWASAVSVESLPLAALEPGVLTQSQAALEALVAHSIRPLEQLVHRASIRPRHPTGRSLQLALFDLDSGAHLGPQIGGHDHGGCQT